MNFMEVHMWNWILRVKALFMMENRYPITKPNRTLDPTLSKMLPIGLPLYNGENILSSDTT